MTPQEIRRKRRRITLTVVVAVVTWLGSLAVAIWQVSARASESATIQRANIVRIDDHEARLRQLERETTAIAADARWIRSYLERKP